MHEGDQFDGYAEFMEDGINKGESEEVAVPVDVVVDLILVQDVFEVADDEPGDEFEQSGIFGIDDLFDIDQVTGNILGIGGHGNKDTKPGEKGGRNFDDSENMFTFAVLFIQSNNLVSWPITEAQKNVSGRMRPKEKKTGIMPARFAMP